MIGQIAVQIDWQLVTIILPFVMVIVVILLGEVLFRRRRGRISPPAMEIRPRTPPVQIPEPHVQESEEDLLERLRRELEETSLLYSSGRISKEEFSLRTGKIEEELVALKAKAPPAEEPKTRLCIHCRQEIPLDALYCDRCGRYLGSATG